MNKLELIGKWTGVCYYQEIRAFVLDSTMQLSILLQDDFGNLRGSVTEICENPSLSRKSGPEKEAYVFQSVSYTHLRLVPSLGKATSRLGLSACMSTASPE